MGLIYICIEQEKGTVSKVRHFGCAQNHCTAYLVGDPQQLEDGAVLLIRNIIVNPPKCASGSCTARYLKREFQQ